MQKEIFVNTAKEVMQTKAKSLEERIGFISIFKQDVCIGTVSVPKPEIQSTRAALRKLRDEIHFDGISCILPGAFTRPVKMGTPEEREIMEHIKQHGKPPTEEGFICCGHDFNNNYFALYTTDGEEIFEESSKYNEGHMDMELIKDIVPMNREGLQ